MANYSAIADVSRTIVALLRDKAVPEPVAKAEQIGVCAPQERGGYVVGLHPYDLKEEVAGKQDTPIVLPDGSLQNPSTEYLVSYVLSVDSKAEAATKALDEQRIMGKVLQLLQDYARLPEQYMPEPLRASGDAMVIQNLPMELEEKMKIWTMFSEPYHLSTFFTVGPIVIESSIIRVPAQRVKTFQLKEKGI